MLVYKISESEVKLVTSGDLADLRGKILPGIQLP